MTGLEVRDLRVAYGGNVAVSSLSLAAPVGRVTGLIGPNGAGKTTVFNACDGFVRPSGGRVWLFDHDVTRMSTAARARRGLGRTFQRVEVCDHMTVRANVALGLEARLVGANPLRQFVAGRTQREAVGEAAERALAVCGISDLAEEYASGLATGQRRLLELARVVAGEFRLLLLDEPGAGLDDEETRELGKILTTIVADHALGVLLVEHDMSLVMDVCSHIYVLDFGELIFEGSPAAVQASPAVRAAYLGDEALMDYTA